MSSTDVRVSEKTEQPRAWRVALVILDWLRQNLFNGWLNSLITLVLLWVIGTLLYRLGDWMLTAAVWDPIVANLRLFMVGRYPGPAAANYPGDQIWRVQTVLALILILFAISGGLWGGIVRGVARGLAIGALFLAIIPFSTSTRLYFLGLFLAMLVAYVGGIYASKLPKERSAPRRWLARTLAALWIASPLIVLLLIRGMGTVLPVVGTNLWGGLLLTLMLAAVGIIASFPIGVLLALGRRSNLPAVRGICVAYIELIRGVPLVTLLFMAAIMLPLFLPANVEIDRVVRAMVAVTLFSAAYLAEYIRGGLQSVPSGQIEAARSLGLNVFQTTSLILLPQALRAVIPAIVGQFISLFKDTSLVIVVGLTELLGTAEFIVTQPQWLGIGGGVQREVFIFVAMVYWVFSFTMARISYRIEHKLGVGVR